MASESDSYDEFSDEIEGDDFSHGEKAELKEALGEEFSSEDNDSYEGPSFDTSEDEDDEEDDGPRKPMVLPPGVNMSKLFSSDAKISSVLPKADMPPPISDVNGYSDGAINGGNKRIIIKRTPAKKSSNDPVPPPVAGPKIRLVRNTNNAGGREAKMKEERMSSAVKTINNIWDKGEN